MKRKAQNQTKNKKRIIKENKRNYINSFNYYNRNIINISGSNSIAYYE